MSALQGHFSHGGPDSEGERRPHLGAEGGRGRSGGGGGGGAGQTDAHLQVLQGRQQAGRVRGRPTHPPSGTRCQV